MDYLEAMDIIGGLSKPSKMPGFSWSTSAFDCQTGTKLRAVPGSVCSSCYACKGNYRFKNVKDAHARRMAGIDHPDFVEAFVLVLNTVYGRMKKTYIKDMVEIQENRFRWHDSGDIQSLEHLEMINEIAKRTPQLDHWLPTKEAGYVGQFKKKHGEFVSNLTVRLSAAMVGETFKKAPMGLPFSAVGVSTGLAQCPAYEQGGQCLDCNNCWNPNINVSYPLH